MLRVPLISVVTHQMKAELLVIVSAFWSIFICYKGFLKANSCILLVYVPVKMVQIEGREVIFYLSSCLV